MPADLVFDTRWIGPHGIGRFAREIAARLEHEPLPLGGSPVAPGDPWRVGRYLRRRRPSFYMTPGFNPPRRPGVPFAITVHDLIHLDVPGEVGPVKRAYYRFLVRPALREADVVFTVSQHARDRIIEWAGVDEFKVVIVGNGIDPELFTPEGPGPRDDGEERPYLFWIGNAKPHKNVRGLIEAFQRSAVPDEVELVMAGTGRETIAPWMSGSTRRMRHLGTIDDDDLAARYRGALAVVVPSLAEGFGLPAAEALACGAPVVSANTTSLPEVVGKAALLVNPLDADQFAAALERVVSDEGLRGALAEAGPHQVRQFRWDAVADRVRKALG